MFCQSPAMQPPRAMNEIRSGFFIDLFLLDLNPSQGSIVALCSSGVGTSLSALQIAAAFFNVAYVSNRIQNFSAALAQFDFQKRLQR